MKTLILTSLIFLCVQSATAQFIIDYGSFKFEEQKNDPANIETKINELLLLEYPNIKKSTKFNDVFSAHTNANGLPTTADVYGKTSPTEITAISFDRDVFGDEQVARESVKILNSLIIEHGYTYSKESYTGYEVKVTQDNLKVKVCLFVDATE
jgi:hypothetical protein